MKKGYLELDLLLLLVYVSLHLQFTMARHPHHHRVQSRECYKCPAGFGVERPCTHFHDTECGACAPDHYSGHRSSWRPCYPCSRCGPGLYVAHPCTAQRDTVCDSCHTYRGPHNGDFYERCVTPPLDPAQNDTRRDQSSQAKESRSVTSLGLSGGVATSVIAASSVVVSALLLVFACFLTTRCRPCSTGDKRYPYIAVSTKEAVML